MLFRGWTRTTLIAASIACLTAAGPAAAQSRIGVASAVRNTVEGVQGAIVRALATGSNVFQLETVKTGKQSAAQLLFLDETSLSIGPSAQVTLDRFVFDPDRGAGDVLLSTGRGAFRFISGSQNPSHYRVQTPVATIGFRGTILGCLVDADMLCFLTQGGAYFEVDGKTYELKRPGQAIKISRGGRVQRFTHDGRFFDLAGIFAFPLYGSDLEAVIRRFDIGDASADLVDELGSRDIDVSPDIPDDDNPDIPNDDVPNDDIPDINCQEQPDLC